MEVKKEINLLFTGVDSVDGYQSDVLNRVYEKLQFHKCILTQKIHDNKDFYNGGIYLNLNYDMCAHCKYGEYYDFNTLLPLSGELLRRMIPYETDAMHMLLRRYNFDIMTYDEQRRYYLQHLQFWNHIFLTENINYVFLTNVPHHTFDYIIYGLAKIYQTKICVLNISVVRRRYFPCSDLENSVIRTINMDNIKRNPILEDDVELYYQAKKYHSNVDIQKVELPQKAHILDERALFFTDIKRTKVYRRYLSLVKSGIKELVTEHSVEKLIENCVKIKEDYAYVKRAYSKLKTMSSIKSYNRITQMPDYEEDYVVYFLHLQPEASTLPMAGVFVDQILAVKILAEALKKTGIKLYVKEHFVQPYREKDFYEDLQKIEGVKFISCFEDSRKLIKHSLAVSTCTGTVMLEAIINGVPAIVFGNSMLNSAEGIYKVQSVEECRRVLQEIKKGSYTVSELKVRNFFKAFGEQTIRMYIYLNEIDDRDTLSIEESKDNLVKTIVDWYYK